MTLVRTGSFFLIIILLFGDVSFVFSGDEPVDAVDATVDASKVLSEAGSPPSCGGSALLRDFPETCETSNMQKPCWWETKREENSNRSEKTRITGPLGEEMPVVTLPSRPFLPEVCDGVQPCSSKDIRKYRQMTFLVSQGLKLLKNNSLHLKRKMSCLLGVDISEALIVDRLIRMTKELCSSSRTRAISVGCSVGVGTSASWDPNQTSQASENPSNLNAQCHGQLNLKFDALNDPDSRDRSEYHKCKIAALMDGIVHESTHALTSYLSRTVPGASMERTSTSDHSRFCNNNDVGRMPTVIQNRCIEIPDSNGSCKSPDRDSNSHSHYYKGRYSSNTRYRCGDQTENCGLWRNEVTARKVSQRLFNSASCKRNNTYFTTGNYGRIRVRSQ